MIHASHITNKENFDAIRRDGYIRPRTEPRAFGEQGGGFSADWIAEDNQFVFFSPSDFYTTLTDGSDAYGFVFDAEFLILGLDGLVGPDLLTKYDALMHECAEAIATQLGPKPIDETGLQAFLEKHAITDAAMIAHIRRDEASHSQDILNGMLDEDDTVPGAADGLKMFRERVGDIHRRERMTGEMAVSWLKASQNVTLGTPFEILVPGPVPIEARLHCIIGGIEE